MKALVRKMYFSILMSILILCTTITTTYAWFGILSSSSIGEFELDIDQVTGDGLELSVDGIHFKNILSSIELKKAILLNKGIPNAFDLGDTAVNSLFEQIILHPATADLDLTTNKLSDFKSIDGSQSDNYYQFDLYFSTIYNLDAGVHSVPVYFADIDMVMGNPKPYTMANPIEHPQLGTIQKMKVDSSNASRIAITKYDAVELKDLNADFLNPKTTIYAPGSETPIKISENDYEYDFGGFDCFNVAIEDYNRKYNDKVKLTFPTDYIRYNQVKDTKLDINNIISESDNLTIRTMIKTTITFWFEGWDPDCLEATSDQVCSIRLRFTTQDPSILR